MKKVATIFLLLAFLVSILTAHTTAGDQQDSNQPPIYTDDQILVKFKSDVRSMFALVPDSADSVLGLGTKAEALSFDAGEGSFLINLNGAMSVEDAVAQAAADPRVEYAEPNFLCSTTETMPNDPFFTEMWGLHNSGDSASDKPGADIGATKAWDLTTGSDNVVIAVIDTGVYLQHGDLAPNAWVNPAETPNNGRDDDGNGFIDDINGWNFAFNNNQVYTDPTTDKHGTHVAGTIGAAGNNGMGVTGVAWHVKLMALKFLGGSNTIDGAVRAINYAIDQKRRGVNVRVINASWVASGDSRSLHDAIAAAGNAGILFVCGAGNGGSDSLGDNIDSPGSAVFPAAYSDIPTLISVAAIDYGDNLAEFSNYGENAVTVAAPGVSIISTYPPDGVSSGGSYGYMRGTSMATPHVSGIAALLAAREPALSASRIKDRIVSTVEPVAALSGKVYASGRANAFNALSNLVEIPDANISGVQATKKLLAVTGSGFVDGSSVIEVNGEALAGTKYDKSSKLPNGTFTRMTVKINKKEMKKLTPIGTQVSITVLNQVTGARTAPYLFTR